MRRGCSNTALVNRSGVHICRPCSCFFVLSNAISSFVSAASWKGSDLEEIRRIVLELFNDGENEQDKDGGENEEYSRRLSDNVGAAMTSISSIQHGAPLGELVSILATSMSQLYSINSMSLSRVKFVKALRERWLKQELLPFMSTSTDEGGGDHKTSPHFLNTLFLLESNAIQLPPLDFRQCLLHQKLQLLNCCIFRIAQELKPSSVGRVSTDYKRREGTGGEDATTYSSPVVESEEGENEAEGSPSDDEFYD
ncbi:unnamed protein product [Peronospora belbahrii]|uniref:Uncharacterized protein n=1 Tax=Peronospora belbahrii TaxID=622444 RepID=A0ABN8D7P7_9STRA|nr:unnamed protein product [Peronospora belbahrii]